MVLMSISDLLFKIWKVDFKPVTSTDSKWALYETMIIYNMERI